MSQSVRQSRILFIHRLAAATPRHPAPPLPPSIHPLPFHSLTSRDSSSSGIAVAGRQSSFAMSSLALFLQEIPFHTAFK